MKMFGKLAVAAVAATVIGAQAGAQTTVNFYTSGAFSGCSSTAVGVSFATCTVGTSVLTYTFNGSLGTPEVKVLTTALPTAFTQYGSFQTSGTGATFAGVSFTLSLFQTLPSLGSQPLVGSVTGTFAPSSGGLLWGPVTPTNWSIGAVKWTLDVDALTQSVRIDPPGVGGAPGLVQTIRGTVSVVPEPSTYALMAAGLAALGMVARRRRNVVA